jgi:hypothetical protein
MAGNSSQNENTFLQKNLIGLQAERGFAAKAFFVMFLVKGAERRGQWITGAQKDLTLRWLRIY